MAIAVFGAGWNGVIQASYDPLLIALSVLVSVFAGITALNLIERIGRSGGPGRQAWLMAAAVSLGGGIWSMHFVAMLAYDIGIPISYGAGLTILSLLLAIGFTAAGLHVVSSRDIRAIDIAFGGSLMGIGISSMHYTGMAAMHMAAVIIYDPMIVAASVAIAVVVSALSLRLSLTTKTIVGRLGAGTGMGLAVTSMHYTGMAAATCHAEPNIAAAAARISSYHLAAGIIVLTIIVQIVAFASAAVDRRVSRVFRTRELEIDRARTARRAAELRASLADRLEQKNVELQAVNREMKEAQSQLVHAAKMASLGQLVAGIAHEVNSPLAFSLGHLATISRIISQLSKDLNGQLTESHSARLDKANLRIEGAISGLERVRDLVARLRTFSRLDEGEFKMTNYQNDIESTLALARHRLPEGVVVAMNFAAENKLYCAPGILNQAVMNLISNAIDAVGDTGTIEIGTRHDQAHYEVFVKDSGPGVPETIRDRIFEPFYTTKDVVPGAGLGLSITYMIVERHRGRIELRQFESGGTEFAIRIPKDLQARLAERPVRQLV